MTQADYRRHDINDRAWEKMAPELPGAAGKVGRKAVDNRLFINAVIWIFRTGAPWRDLPPAYGHWKNVQRRFCRWRDRGVWAMLLDMFIEDADFEWLSVDSSYLKVHPHACGAEGGNQAMSRTKGGLNTKVHMAVDAHGMPVRAVVTDGTTADAHVFEKVIEDLPAAAVLADKAYDVNPVIDHLAEQGIVAVIPSRKNRIAQRNCDKDLYKIRHLIENAFLKLKQWRGIATRYAKKASSFLAIIQIRCLMLWLKII